MDLTQRVVKRFKAAQVSKFLKAYFDRCLTVNRTDVARRIEEWGKDAGRDLTEENPQKSEQDILRLAGQPEIPWEKYLDDGLLIQSVEAVLGPVLSRFDVTHSTEESFVEVSGDKIELHSKAYGASYNIDPTDPYDYVEAPAMEDDHSRDIEQALKSTGASVQVATKIEKDPRYGDLQNVVFKIRAVWDFKPLRDYVPPSLVKLYTEAVLTGMRSARS